MRELTKTDIKSITGGSLLYGWYPRGLNGLGINFDTVAVFGPGAVTLPSFSAGPIISSPGPVAFHVPSPFGEADC